jgi:hypothetical protein
MWLNPKGSCQALQLGGHPTRVHTTTTPKHVAPQLKAFVRVFEGILQVCASVPRVQSSESFFRDLWESFRGEQSVQGGEKGLGEVSRTFVMSASGPEATRSKLTQLAACQHSIALEHTITRSLPSMNV